MTGLCCGSLLQADLFGLADAAAHAGFDEITIWPTLHTAAVRAGHSPAEIRTRLDDLGVTVTELDPICTWLPVDIPATAVTARFAAYSEDDFYDLAESLGSTSINVIRGDDVDVSDDEMIEHLGSFADRAGLRGLRVYLEFLPWSRVGTLDHAARVVEGVGRANCGLHLDVWHLIRSGGSVEQLRDVDPALITAVQLSDLDPVPWDNLMAETSSGRRLLGHGDGTARAAVDVLDAMGVTAPMNVEIFSSELMAMPSREAATAIAASISTF